jgi:hypothetical protein
MDSAAFDNRSHRAEWKNATAMIWNDHLLASQTVPPLLMTPGAADEFESSAA